ncbi:calpain-1 catalytic subunit-like [Epinephelus moara]|uniref:calpain-1 catalytic subunit-like n=1 Tax=Epinephelus moara TaxID=300413 RepID=UPI00214F2FC9|nr:calpain-1 catalytic subunit-like [Epinephelus moara]
MPSTCTSIINLRYQDGSEGSSTNPAKFNHQDYVQLRDTHQRRQRLFVDNTFPPNSQSLGDLPDMSYRRQAQVEWLRPADILKLQNNNDDATFFSKGASRFDFSQGNVGNCWFLAALSSLTIHKGLLVQVVPMDQTFENYAGIFHFRFWRFGKWVDVVIDDYLPTIDQQLLSVRSKSGNEFWVPLLEKAYAKVCGSYADMNAGLPSEACKDFTGGVHMTYELHNAHSAGHDVELWNALSRATECKSMICCGTAPGGDTIVNSVEANGIVNQHAYAVTAVTEVEYYGSNVKLVRLLNPWGRKEWNGKWSDKSDMWNRVSPEDREKCFDRNDGEFWMELEDFCENFYDLFICCENPNFIDGDLTCQWQCMTYDGSWVAGRSAGGNASYPSFETNPQYRVQVTKIDRDEKEDKNVLFSLMQKPQQQHRKGQTSYPIAVTVYKVPPGTPQGRLRSSFFNRNMPLKHTQLYTNKRDLIEQHSLEPGEYVVIPSTMRPHMSADFVLSVFTKSEAKISPHDGDDDDHDHDHENEENLILPEPPTDKEDEKEDNTDRDPTLAMFNRYADQYGELKARQLQKLLNNNFPHGNGRNGFSLDTCRSMIAAVDVDQRMKMTFTEFSTLWEKINEYKKKFYHADLNKSGALSDYELQQAIDAAGFNVNDILVRLLMFRYTDETATTMESFITLMLRLDKASDVFKGKSSDGVIYLNWDEWSTFSTYN